MNADTPDEEVTLLLTAADIERRVAALAAEIGAAMAEPFTMIAVLKGAFVFAADLLRELSRVGCHPRIDFVRLGSYGDAATSSGRVTLRGEPPRGVSGRCVLLVDDVLDTGLTLVEAKRLIEGLGAVEVRTCVLLRKLGRQTVEVEPDFVGFDIEDRFVVGYGIDFAEQHRDLPYVGWVEPEPTPR